MFSQNANLVVGHSVCGSPLVMHVFLPDTVQVCIDSLKSIPKPNILLIGGVHGDEVEGVWLMEAAVEKWKSKGSLNSGITVVVLARANPDGFERGTRGNANGVDLNRNLPSMDWTKEFENPRYMPGKERNSEPESKALVNAIEALSPIAILSAHSFSKMQINVNGPADAWAKELEPLCRYPITHDIGYPTPGCLGNFAGKEREIPTITLEILRGLSKEEVLTTHLPIVDKAVQFWSGMQSKCNEVSSAN